MAEPAQTIHSYLQSLRVQKLVLRSVDEKRPQVAGAGMTVVRLKYVEVVTVEGGARVAQTFHGVTMDEARTSAKAWGHTVVERSGNIT